MIHLESVSQLVGGGGDTPGVCESPCGGGGIHLESVSHLAGGGGG